MGSARPVGLGASNPALWDPDSGPPALAVVGSLGTDFRALLWASPRRLPKVKAGDVEGAPELFCKTRPTLPRKGCFLNFHVCGPLFRRVFGSAVCAIYAQRIRSDPLRAA